MIVADKPAGADQTGGQHPEEMTHGVKPAEPPVWDKPGMKARLADAELAAAAVAIFLKDMPVQIEALRSLLAEGDAAGAEMRSHTIKGAAANLGGERLRMAAFRLEKAAHAGDLSAAREMAEHLAIELKALEREMMKEIGGAGGA